MKKRLLAMLLLVVMVLSMAACGEKVDPTDAPKTTDAPKATDADATDAPTEAEPVERVKVVWLGYYTGNIAISEDTRIEQYIEENIPWIDLVPVTDVTKENFDAFVSSGGTEEITCYVSYFGTNYQYMYDQGLIREFPEEWLWEYYPSGMEIIADFDPRFFDEDINLVSGKCLYIPHMLNQDTAKMVMLFRQDWLDNLGLEEPKTLQEFHDVLYAFTYDDPDGNGIDDTYGIDVIYNSFGGFWPIYTSLGFTMGNGSGSFVKQADNSVIYTAVLEEYREGLRIVKSWYDEGIIHPECVTDGGTDVKTKWANGTVGFYTNTISSAWGDAASQVIPMVELTYGEGSVGVLHPMTSEYGGELLGDGRVHTTTGGNATGGVSSVVFTTSATDEQIIAVLKMLEAITADQELYKTIYYGFEGEHYDMVDGKLVQRSDVTEEVRAESGFGAYFRSGIPSDETVELIMSERDIYVQEVADSWPMEVGYMTTRMHTTDQLNQAYQTYFAEVKACEREYYANVLLGVANLEEDWDAYVQQMYDIGLEEILAEYKELLSE